MNSSELLINFPRVYLSLRFELVQVQGYSRGNKLSKANWSKRYERVHFLIRMMKVLLLGSDALFVSSSN